MSTDRPIDLVLERLKGVQAQTNGQYKAMCPAHEDRTPSLGIKEGDDGRVLLKCHAGCETEVVVRALGLETKDLFPPKSSTSKGARGNSRGTAKKKLTATWQIKDRSGKHRADHVRYDNPDNPNDKECRWRQPSGKWGLNGTKLPDLPLYGSELVDSWPLKQALILVEGEPAKDAAHKAGLNALGTVTGASSTPGPEALEVARDRTVVLWPDNDPEGREHMHRIGAALHSIATEVRWFEWEDAPDKGDAADHPAIAEKEAEGLAELKRQLFEATVWAQPPSPEDEAWAVCGQLAQRENLTAVFADALKRSGVAGESRLLRLLYLIITSRCLDKPVSVAIKGPSSGGKSYSVEKVLETFPDTAYYALTSMSEKALIYLDEDMQHRFLVIYETSGMAGDMQTYLMRTLLSENRIRYQTAESTSQGVKPRLLELEGPTGLIVTTTQTRMHPENETRMISLTVTDTQEQTKNVFHALAEEDREPVDLEPWRQLQVWLEGQSNVASVPYGKALAELVPPVAVRLRRDFGAVLALVRAHAILHQAVREKDGKGRVIATIGDYAIVRQLVADLVSEGVDATVSKTMRETVGAVTNLTANEDTVGLKAVAKYLKLDKASASRRVKAAREAGYLVNLEETKGKPAKIALGESLPADLVILPTVEDLGGEWNRCTVAGETGGRERGAENEAESVANGDCNGAQHRNGQGPKYHENASFEAEPHQGSSHNTADEPPNSQNRGRGSLEDATAQHSDEDADKPSDATQHATAAQHPRADSSSAETSDSWGEI
ncbi:MAG: hypothetical protein WKF53_12410 [Rubrobacter sp.]